MRRSASEVIRELEIRVASLEKSARLLEHFGYASHINGLEKSVLDHLNFDHSDVEWEVTNVDFKRDGARDGYAEVTGRFKTKKYLMIDYDSSTVTDILEEQQPFKDSEFVNYTRLGDDAKGEIYPDARKNPNLPGMIEINFDRGNVEWVVRSSKFDFELKSTLRPDVDAEMLAKEVNKRLR
jgi:hypothetical protein